MNKHLGKGSQVPAYLNATLQHLEPQNSLLKWSQLPSMTSSQASPSDSRAHPKLLPAEDPASTLSSSLPSSS